MTPRGRGGEVMQGTVLDEVEGMRSSKGGEGAQEQARCGDLEAGRAERGDAGGDDAAGPVRPGAVGSCEVVARKGS